MIKQLLIKNYSLIKNINISPGGGLNIITGESGAGKSIILGALDLLLGGRCGNKILINKKEKCIVEVIFSLKKEKRLENLFINLDLDYDNEIIVRREVNSNGKSRSFINDTPVKLIDLRNIVSNFIDIHSQYDNILLKKPGFQLELIDIYANNENLRLEYQGSYFKYKELKKEYNTLIKQSEDQKKSLDYNKFLLNELKEIDLASQNLNQIENAHTVLENAEDIKVKLNDILFIFDKGETPVVNLIRETSKIINELSTISPKFNDISRRIQSSIIEIDDIVSEIEKEQSQIEINPENLIQLKEKLNIIYRLQQKHRVDTVEELLLIQEKLEIEVNKVENIEEIICNTKEKIEKEFSSMLEKGKKLSESRKSVFNEFIPKIEGLLSNLDMKEAKLKINQNSCEPKETGIDNIEVLFSSNKGIIPKRIQEVASGGELSRLIFCLKYIISEKSSISTIVFDEIDTGISGEIAMKMASMMNIMSLNHQIITITHLPQIAAKGYKHYFVYKNNKLVTAESNIKELNEEERTLEIAKMIGGDPPSDITLRNAKEMLSNENISYKLK